MKILPKDIYIFETGRNVEKREKRRSRGPIYKVERNLPTCKRALQIFYLTMIVEYFMSNTLNFIMNLITLGNVDFICEMPSHLYRRTLHFYNSLSTIFHILSWLFPNLSHLQHSSSLSQASCFFNLFFLFTFFSSFVPNTSFFSSPFDHFLH